MLNSTVMNFHEATPEPAGGRFVPLYLILDSSGSMEGEPLQAVLKGLEIFKQELEADPAAASIVRVGVIAFNNEAEFVTDGLVSVRDLQIPELTASGGTYLEKAFELAEESIDRDVKIAVKGGQRGDYKPSILVFTDGYPSSNEWKASRKALLNRGDDLVHIQKIMAVGCGPDIEEAILQEISTEDYRKIDTDFKDIQELFQEFSQSVVRSVQPGADPGSVTVKVSSPTPREDVMGSGDDSDDDYDFTP